MRYQFNTSLLSIILVSTLPACSQVEMGAAHPQGSLTTAATPSGGGGGGTSGGCTSTQFGSQCNGGSTPPEPGAHAYLYNLTPIPNPNGTASTVGNYVGETVIGNMSMFTPQSVIPGVDLYTTGINVPLQAWTSGFPGYSNLQEWFGLCYNGTWTVPVSGTYTIVSAVDDAVAVWVDGKVVGENDDGNVFSTEQAVNGLLGQDYSASPMAFTAINLTAGNHSVEIMFYQGWPKLLELQVWALPPGVALSSTSAPADAYLMQLSSPAPGTITCPH